MYKVAREEQARYHMVDMKRNDNTFMLREDFWGLLVVSRDAEDESSVLCIKYKV